VTTRRGTNPAATRRASHNVHTAILADRSGRAERTQRDRNQLNDIEHLIHYLKSLSQTRGDMGLAETHLTLGQESGELLGSIGSRRFADTHSRRFADTQANSLTVAAACTPVNRGSLPPIERLPEISTQLIVVERLFQAAREKGSGAIPMPGDEEWDSFWLGLERIVRQVRRLAEDMYAQARVENC
jgi:hypothetical protein